MRDDSVRIMERAIIGAMISNIDAAREVQERIAHSDFLVPLHRKIASIIFRAIDEDGKSAVVDVNSVAYWSDTSVDDIKAIVHDAASPENFQVYLAAICEAAYNRKLVNLASRIRSIVEDDRLDAASKAAKIESEVSDIVTVGREETIGMGECAIMAVSRIIEVAESRMGMLGFSSGFSKLDEITSGFQGGQYIVVAGRPSMGKTSFAMAVSDAIVKSAEAMDKPGLLLYCSLEMSGAQLSRRYIAMKADIPMHRLKVGALTRAEWDMVADISNGLSGSRIKFNVSFEMRIENLRNTARKMKRKDGLVGIVIDYIQLMRSDLKGENRERQISEISRTLKSISLELDVPVIVLSQLNRSLEQRADKRPIMSDLRESGAIEQDADVILFLYRDEVYNPATRDRGKAELIVSKNRDGQTGTIFVPFDADRLRFVQDVDYSLFRNRPRQTDLPKSRF